MPNGEVVHVSGTGTWKEFVVHDSDGVVVHQKKFYKSEFGELLGNPDYTDYMNALYNAALVVGGNNNENSTIGNLDEDSYQEMKGAEDAS